MRRYKDLKARFKAYVTAHDRAIQSGADRDAPSENAMHLYMGAVTEALKKAGVHNEVDVCPEWKMDGFTIMEASAAARSKREEERRNERLAEERRNKLGRKIRPGARSFCKSIRRR